MKDSIINFMVLLIGFSFLCCNQISDTKIEKSVKEYMKTEVNDPSKYEPLSFEVDLFICVIRIQKNLIFLKDCLMWQLIKVFGLINM